MITESFDISSEPMMTPATFYGENGTLFDVCIFTFSTEIVADALRRLDCTQVSEIRACNGSRPVYCFEQDGKRVGLCLAQIGSTLAANDAIEVNCLTGATKFIFFGSAGSLRTDLTAGKLVVPTEAYRDEGMSYHYAPPADYITVRNAPAMDAMLTELRVPHVCGRCWTTDAFYRETRALVAKRQSEGCLAVEMEVAGVQAVCDFYGWELYDFLMCGDVLDAEEYSRGELHNANHCLDNFALAREIARRIAD